MPLVQGNAEIIEYKVWGSAHGEAAGGSWAYLVSGAWAQDSHDRDGLGGRRRPRACPMETTITPSKCSRVPRVANPEGLEVGLFGVITLLCPKLPCPRINSFQEPEGSSWRETPVLTYAYHERNSSSDLCVPRIPNLAGGVPVKHVLLVIVDE
jgi:hypothetical protein